MNRDELIRLAWGVSLVQKDRLLLLALAHLADIEGIIHTETQTLGKMTRLPCERIKYGLRKLQRWGFVEIEGGPVNEDGNLGEIRMNEERLKSVKSGRQNPVARRRKFE